MRENETQQQNREREFQNRVLAALEKPKRNRFLAFINAPAFLWLLSVIVLSIGGTYYTNYKQCMADAESLDRDFRSARLKLLGRQFALIPSMLKAKSFEELRTLLNTKGEDNKTLVQLWSDLSGDQVRIDMKALKPNLDRIQQPLTSLPDYNKFRSVFVGLVPPNLNDQDLPGFQKMLGPFLTDTADLMFLMPLFDYMCTPRNVVTLMNGYRPLILLRAVSVQGELDILKGVEEALK